MKSIGEPAREITAAKSERVNLAYLEWIIKKKSCIREHKQRKVWACAACHFKPYSLHITHIYIPITHNVIYLF